MIYIRARKHGKDWQYRDVEDDNKLQDILDWVWKTYGDGETVLYIPAQFRVIEQPKKGRRK